MKKARKLLVTLLVLTFLLSTFNVGFAADNDDVSRTPAVDRAIALGILRGDDQGNLNLDKPITRAEALALIIRISGLEVSADLMKGATIFPDVNSDPSLQWATGYINLGVGHGIINGYPDGTFKGNAQVTYAEMAKMLLYAMNYGVTVEGGVWPVAVMGKAESLGVFNKVNASPNVPAVRGDVVKMIDNCLDVYHLEQYGYGALPTYRESDKTFLTKMGIDEVEGRIDSFDDEEKEVIIDVAKVNGDELANVKSEKYNYIEGVSFAGLKGVNVTAWVLDEEEVVFVSVEDTIVFDFIKEDDGDFLLENQDKEYAFYRDSFEASDKLTDEQVSDLNGHFVKAAIDGKKALIIEDYGLFGSLNKGLIKSIDDDVIEYIRGDSTRRVRGLEDADLLVVINGEVASYDDLEEGMYFEFIEDSVEGDFDYVIAATDKTVKGEVDKVKIDGNKVKEVRIDGTYYKAADPLYASTDGGKEYDAVTDLDDFFGEDVVAALNLVGKVVYIRGDVDPDSASFYGFALDFDRFDDRVRVAREVDGELKRVTYNVDTDKVEDAGLPGGVANLALLSTGKDYKNVYKFTLNADSEVRKIEAITWNVNTTVKEFNDDGNYILLANNKRVYADDAVIYGIEYSTKADGSENIEEISLLLWKDIKATDIQNKTVKIYADDVEADIIVLKHDGVEFKDSTDYKVAFVTERHKITKDDYEYDIVTGEGKDTIVSEDFAGKETIILFTVDDDNEVDIVVDYVYTEIGNWGNKPDINKKASDWEGGKGTASDNATTKYLYVNDGTIDVIYRVASDVVVYLIDDDGDYVQKDITDIVEDDLVWFLTYKGQVKFVFYREN